MSEVVALLDTGSWTLDASRRVLSDARRTQAAVRDVIVTYRAHRFSRISGGSGQASAPDGDGGPEHARARLKLLVTRHEIPRIYAGYNSAPRTCDVCSRDIKFGAQQYDIEFAALAFTLDRDCFDLWQREMLAASRQKA